jgi:hypothetical protein
MERLDDDRSDAVCEACRRAESGDTGFNSKLSATAVCDVGRADKNRGRLERVSELF